MDEMGMSSCLLICVTHGESILADRAQSILGSREWVTGEGVNGEGKSADERKQQRNLPARGFRPAVLVVGMVGIMTFGFWKLGKGIREQK